MFLSKFILLIIFVLSNVPFVSQDGIGWWRHNDCGAASGAMIIEYYTEVKLSATTYYEDLDVSGDDAQAVMDIMSWLKVYGISSEYHYGLTFDELLRLLYQGPVIALVEHPVIGGHYIVIVGYTNYGLLIHDPREGPFILISFDEFEKMWYYPASWQHNRIVVPSLDRE